jgi:hypothetical protein
MPGHDQETGRQRRAGSCGTSRLKCQPASKSEKQLQEQIQTIATAIGKPVAKAPTIVNVNAANRFASGRSSSIDMSLAPPRGKIEKPRPGQMR